MSETCPKTARQVEHVMREVCPRCRQYDCPSLHGCDTSKDRFAAALRRFIRAGHALVEVWDGDGFNADEEFGPCVDWANGLLFPMSMDEWLLELQAWGEGEKK